MNHVVIMAGGVGSRFWPMSTPERSKQFIDVLGVGRTLLQLTVDRLAPLCPVQNVWVVTSVQYKQLVREQLPEIPESNILLEPCMRNTAPCIAYAAWKIKKRDPEANLVISAADHIVMDVNEFVRVVKKGLDFVAGADRILTLGMRPTRPETGYGYIKIKSQDLSAESCEEIREVEGFQEKPDLETVRKYVTGGGYYWNAGIFLWNVKTIEKAFRANKPEMAELFDAMEQAFYTPEEQVLLEQKFPECEKISIDYAIMERARNIFVFLADFGWSDLGTWGSLYEQLPKDAEGNAVVGKKVSLVESRGCVVHVPEDKKMVLQGLEDYIIVENQGVLLICRKADEQRIKEFSSGF